MGARDARRTKGSIGLAGLVCLLSAVRVAALDLWVVPGKFLLRPGEKVRVFLNSGDEYPGSVSLLGEYRVQRFELISASGRRPMRGFVADGKSLTAEMTAPEEGTAILALAIKPRLVRLKADEFNDYLEEDGLPQILALREKRGELGEPVVERYTKWAKAIVKVGEGRDVTWSQPAGLKMEIVPEKNPYEIRPGEEMRVQVLFESQFVPGLTVSGSRAGGSRSEVRGVTDSEGRVGLVIPEPGRWYLRSVHMIRVEEDPQVQWESHWATLTFEVLP